MHVIDMETLENILASDDELPGDYEDEVETPAYQMNDRFTDIDFEWLNNKTVRKFHEPVIQELQRKLNDKISLLNHSEMAFIDSGILKKQDLVCLQHVAPVINDVTVIWFLEFLKYKDLHSKFGYLKSCLVPIEEYRNTFKLDTDNCQKSIDFIINIKANC